MIAHKFTVILTTEHKYVAQCHAMVRKKYHWMLILVKKYSFSDKNSLRSNFFSYVFISLVVDPVCTVSKSQHILTVCSEFYSAMRLNGHHHQRNCAWHFFLFMCIVFQNAKINGDKNHLCLKITNYNEM